VAEGNVTAQKVPAPEGPVCQKFPWVRLQYLYLLRVPILMALAILVFPVVSLCWLRELLGNLFVVDPWGIFCTVVATEMLAFGILAETRVVLLNGVERFGILQGMKDDVIRKKSLILTEILPLPMAIALIISNGQVATPGPAITRVIFGVSAILVAHIAVFAVLWFSVLFSPRYPDAYEPPDPKRPKASTRFLLPFRFMCCWIDWAYAKTPIPVKWKEWFGLQVKSWPPSITAGYFDPLTSLPYPGQLLSFGMLILSYGMYQFIGYLKHARLGESFGVPAVAFVVMLLIVLTWLLSMASFFLDRYRLPLLLPGVFFILSTNLTFGYDRFYKLRPVIVPLIIGIWLVLIASLFVNALHRFRRFLLILGLSLILFANLISDTDHFYELRTADQLTEVTPGQVLNAAARLNPDQDHPNGRVVVVATAGGGIQAAAWTAQVLTGLQAEIKGDSPSKSFANSIAAISSVSGGAVGAMFFVSRYRTTGTEQGFPSNTDLSKIVEDAEAPALGDVAWAMVYPDLSRALIPFSKWTSNRLFDRGWALEQAWRTRGNLDATLGDWRSGVWQGYRPAVIFNSTIVESGEPLLLATTDMDEKVIEGLGHRTLAGLLPGYDVPVVTAVRLAASFPFVTPASRADYDSKSDHDPQAGSAVVENNAKYHIVDGGYYDNYGINSLLDFLGKALTAAQKDKAPDILIIQIRSFPSEARSPEGESRGWFYQFWAPLAALMRVRTTGQLVRDGEAITSFIDLWRAHGVNIQQATFEFKGVNAPLSWQMNREQTEAIRNQWIGLIKDPNSLEWQRVNCFFQSRNQECASLAHFKQKEAW
jgi:hypothetical protein